MESGRKRDGQKRGRIQLVTLQGHGTIVRNSCRALHNHSRLCCGTTQLCLLSPDTGGSDRNTPHNFHSSQSSADVTVSPLLNKFRGLNTGKPTLSTMNVSKAHPEFQTVVAHALKLTQLID